MNEIFDSVSRSFSVVCFFLPLESDTYNLKETSPR